MDTNDPKITNRLQVDFNKLIGLYFKTSEKVFQSILKNKIKDFGDLISGDLNLKSSEDVLIYLYKALKARVLTGGLRQTVKINQFDFSEFKKKGWEYKTISFLAGMLKENQNIVKSAILHGSFATKDFVRDFSDLDLVIVLNDEIFSSSEKLKIARKVLSRYSLLCYKIDILAHHEFMFLTEFDLKNYTQIFLPLKVYDKSLVLSGDSELEISFRKTPEVIRSKLEKTLKIFSDEKLFKRNGFDPFYFKNTLANLMIVPSLVFGLLGNGINKKDSFQRFYENYPYIQNKALKMASQKRCVWRQLNFLKLMPNFCFKFFPVFIIRFKIKINRKIAKILFVLKPKAEIKKFFYLAKDFSNDVFNTFLRKNE